MGRDQNFVSEVILSATRHFLKNVGLLITNSYHFDTCVKSSVFFLLNIFTFSDLEQYLGVILQKNERHLTARVIKLSTKNYRISQRELSFFRRSYRTVGYISSV
jgi:hypothetical protein